MNPGQAMKGIDFPQLLDSADDGIYVADGDGMIVYANRAILEITGYGRDVLVGSRTSVFKSGEMSTAYYARLWSTLRNGGVWREVIVNRRANGERYVASQTITPVEQDDGSVMFFAVQRDLSARPIFTEESAAVDPQIEMKLAQAELLLQETYHRVKNDTIRSSAMLELQAARAESEDVREALSIAAQRLTVVARLYESLSARPHGREVDGREFFDEILTGLQRTTLPQECRTSLSCTSRLIDTRLAVALSLILNEAATNATKHGFAAGREPVFSVDVAWADGTIELSIADNGDGYPNDRVPGLGLSLVEQLARQHNGSVSFTNDPGATITVRIPTPPPKEKS